MDSSTQARDDATTSHLNIPPGYSVREMSDGHKYIVPNFLINATELDIQSDALKRSLEVRRAPGGVSHSLVQNKHMPVV
jgi:hypothetical protein